MKSNRGQIRFDGNRTSRRKLPRTKGKDGIFSPSKILLRCPGFPFLRFIRSALAQKRRGETLRPWEFHREMERAMELLQIDPSYGERDLNVGFSGGEKKKSEILQMLLLKPSLAILDETDSGLDVDAVRTVSQGVKEYQKDGDRGLLIITHSTRILESLQVDYTHVMVNGKIVKTGDASLVEQINRTGFEPFLHDAAD